MSKSNYIYTCRDCGDNNLLVDEMKWGITKPNKCKRCWNKDQRVYRAKNKKKFREYDKRRPESILEWKLKNRFGITLEEYQRLFDLQLGGCAICKQPEKDQNLAVDHDHVTGRVRGLLCRKCNIALGMLKEDEDIIWNLLDYLKTYCIKQTA